MATDINKKNEYAKGTQRKVRTLLAFFVSCFLGLSTFPEVVSAAPTGGSVEYGGVTITTNGTTTTINQTTDKAIINWQNFNIAPNELTQFIQQQGSGSIALNRISGGPTTILGSLIANGQIWLLNPSGILFGAGSQVNVAGLLATTANISSQDFLSGNYKFSQSSTVNGAIVNEGKIVATGGAEHGYVILAGTGVSNSGVIEANMGKVALAAGNVFTVDFHGDNLINFGTGAEVTQKAVDAKGRVLNDAVSNSGTIMANGGKVLLTARAAEGVVDNVINMSGHIEAKAAVQRGGEIILMGGDHGVVQVSGKMYASSAKNSGMKGGKVKILGNKVAVVNSALIDVSGDIGGGEVLIGGDYQGKNSAVQNAQRTLVGSDVQVNADALTSGDGGKVIVWADGDTRFYGNISARGGESSGNGGFIETSGHESLSVAGFVDTSAVNGEMGSWLLDPKNIIVATGGTATTTQVATFASDATLTDTIAPSAINGSLTTINLQANNNITFNNNVAMSTLLAGLTVRAGGTITVADGVSITTNAGAISFTANDSGAIVANRDAGAGSIVMGSGSSVSATGLGAALTLTVGSTATGGFTPGDITLGALTATVANNITITSPNAVTLNGVITLATGSIAINANTDAAGASGVIQNSGATITTSSLVGNAVAINVNAAGGGTGGVSLGDNITVGSGATIVIATNTGGNTTGGSIIQTGGLLQLGATGTGTGNFTLSVSSAGLNSIGTSGTNIATKSAGGTLNLIAGSGGAFVSNTGNLTLATPTLNANSPLSVISSATLTLPNAAISTGTGDLTLRSNGGALNLANSLTTTSGNITLFATGLLTVDELVTTSGGNISLTGSGITQATGIVVNATSGNITANAGAGTLTMNSGSQLLSTGNITITADGVALTSAQIGGTGTNAGSANTVIIQPSTAGTTIGIGSGSPSGTLNLLDTELTQVRASNVQLGNSSAGAMNITAWTPLSTFASSSLTLSTANKLTVAGAMNLASSGGDLTINANDADFNAAVTLASGKNLTVNAVGSIGLGATTGTMTMSGAELQNITTNNLTLNSGSNTGITVDGISAANSANIANTVFLNATAGTNPTLDTHFF